MRIPGLVWWTLPLCLVAGSAFAQEKKSTTGTKAPTQKSEKKTDQLDINSASKDELKALPGIDTPVLYDTPRAQSNYARRGDASGMGAVYDRPAQKHGLRGEAVWVERTGL